MGGKHHVQKGMANAFHKHCESQCSFTLHNGGETLHETLKGEFHHFAKEDKQVLNNMPHMEFCNLFCELL